MVNGTLLNFGKRYEDDLRVIFDQWPKLHLGLDALSNQKNLERYLIDTYASFLVSLMNFLIRYVQDIYDNALFALSNYVSILKLQYKK